MVEGSDSQAGDLKENEVMEENGKTTSEQTAQDEAVASGTPEVVDVPEPAPQAGEEVGGAEVEVSADAESPEAPSAPEEREGREDFASMIEESKVEEHSRDIKIGDKVSGVLVKIGPENSFVDFGGRSEGVIKTSELQDGGAAKKGEMLFSEGDPFEAYVMADREEMLLSRFLRQEDRNADFLYQAFKAGIPVEGKINAVNKWGLGVDIQGVRAFCPISQIDTRYVEDTAEYRGQTFSFKITEFRDRGRNIVVSRRALLEAEQNKQADEIRTGIVKGAVLEGEVTRLEPFGAFVDLGGGVEGLVHVSEISHQRVEHPQEVLQEGEKIKVAVVRVKSLGNKRRERISLSLKALEEDPWEVISRQYKPGTVVQGKVDVLEDYGAFVELGPDVRGLVHVSEMADKRIGHPREVVSVGEEVTVAVLELDRRRRRLRLSMKRVESMEDATHLKEFQARRKKEKEEPQQGGNALTDALKRARLID